jgi:hypothetical protein
VANIFTWHDNELRDNHLTGLRDNNHLTELRAEKTFAQCFFIMDFIEENVVQHFLLEILLEKRLRNVFFIRETVCAMFFIRISLERTVRKVFLLGFH